MIVSGFLSQPKLLALLLASFAFACSSEEESGDKPASGGAGGGGAGGNSSGGGSGGEQGGSGGAAPVNCDKTPCEGQEVFGSALQACCQPSGECGVLLQTSCAPLSMLDQITSLLPSNETVVLDDSCPTREVPDRLGDGGTIQAPGCCDVSGVCGFSSEGMGAPFTACLTPSEISTLSTQAQAQGQGSEASFDAGAEVPCGSGSSGGDAGDDAGADAAN